MFDLPANCPLLHDNVRPTDHRKDALPFMDLGSYLPHDERIAELILRTRVAVEPCRRMNACDDEPKPLVKALGANIELQVVGRSEHASVSTIP